MCIESNTKIIFIVLDSKASFTLQFSSVVQSCPTLCDPMNRSTPGLPVHHQLFGRNDAKAETPVFWSPHAKS